MSLGSIPPTLPLHGPSTHAGSSPEGDTALDEEHAHVPAANHEQHAAKAQVDEADEDLHRLREAPRLSAAGPVPHRPLPAPPSSSLLATGKETQILFFRGDIITATNKDTFKEKASSPQPTVPTKPSSQPACLLLSALIRGSQASRCRYT